MTAVPMLLVIVSGLLLQVKKQVSWVQPPTQKGSQANVRPQQGWDDILAICQAIPEAQITDWESIERLDIQPGKGIAKVQSVNRWELQIDMADGRVLSSTYRRSDLIESLHDGSFFSDFAKLWVFLPNGLVLLGLWLTGAWLWYLPFLAKRRSQAKSSLTNK